MAMKKTLVNIAVFAGVIAVIIILLLSFGTDEGAKFVYKGNRDHRIIEIKPKEYQCSECNMDVENLNYMAEIVTEEGNTYFFDDIGCVVLWLKNHTPKIARMVTKTLDTHRWIDAKKAWYSRTDATPMGYGFAAYEVKKEGMIPYEEMRTLMLQGKNLHDPFVKKQLLSH
jgi:uncharacterized protein (UPF0128 family)